MSARYFCDVCEKEMPEGESNRLKVKAGKINIEVMHALNGLWNGGHICHDCIRRAVKAGRPFKENASP